MLPHLDFRLYGYQKKSHQSANLFFFFLIHLRFWRKICCWEHSRKCLILEKYNYHTNPHFLCECMNRWFKLQPLFLLLSLKYSFFIQVSRCLDVMLQDVQWFPMSPWAIRHAVSWHADSNDSGYCHSIDGFGVQNQEKIIIVKIINLPNC